MATVMAAVMADTTVDLEEEELGSRPHRSRLGLERQGPAEIASCDHLPKGEMRNRKHLIQAGFKCK